MPQLLTLSATFSVEEEDEPQFAEVLSLVELRLRSLDDIYGCAADVRSSERRYEVVVEVEGERIDYQLAQEEFELALREAIHRFSEEPRVDEPMVIEGD